MYWTETRRTLVTVIIIISRSSSINSFMYLLK